MCSEIPKACFEGFCNTLTANFCCTFELGVLEILAKRSTLVYTIWNTITTLCHRRAPRRRHPQLGIAQVLGDLLHEVLKRMILLWHLL